MPTNVPTKAPIKAPGGYTFRPPPPPLSWEADLASRTATLQNMMSPRPMPQLPKPPPAQLALPPGPRPMYGPAIPAPASNPLSGTIGQGYAQAGVSGAPGELSSALGVPKSYLPPPPTPTAMVADANPFPAMRIVGASGEGSIKGLAGKILNNRGAFATGGMGLTSAAGAMATQGLLDQTGVTQSAPGRIVNDALQGAWAGGPISLPAAGVGAIGFGAAGAGREIGRNQLENVTRGAQTGDHGAGIRDTAALAALGVIPFVGPLAMAGASSQQFKDLTGMDSKIGGVTQQLKGAVGIGDSTSGSAADLIKSTAAPQIETQAREYLSSQVAAAPDDIRSVYIDMGASRDTADTARKQYEQAAKANKVMYDRGMLTVPEYLETITNEDGTVTRPDGSELTPQDTAGWQQVENEDGTVDYMRPRAATQEDLDALNYQTYQQILQAAPEVAAEDQAAEEQKRQQRNEMLGMQMATQRFLQPYVDQSNALSAQIGSFGPMYAPIAAGVQNQTNAFGMAAHLQPGLMMMEQQAAARQAEAQRQAELEDWMIKEQYKAQMKAGSESGGSTSDSEEIAAGLTGR